MIATYIRNVLRSNLRISLVQVSKLPRYLSDWLIEVCYQLKFYATGLRSWRKKSMLSVRKLTSRPIRNGIWARVFWHASELFCTGKKKILVNMFSRLVHPRGRAAAVEMGWRNQLEHASESGLQRPVTRLLLFWHFEYSDVNRHDSNTALLYYKLLYYWAIGLSLY